MNIISLCKLLTTKELIALGKSRTKLFQVTTISFLVIEKKRHTLKVQRDSSVLARWGFGRSICLQSLWPGVEF